MTSNHIIAKSMASFRKTVTRNKTKQNYISNDKVEAEETFQVKIVCTILCH